MSGSGSPIAEARQYVDSTLLPQLEEPSRSMVRPMLVGPLERSMATALQGAARDLIRSGAAKIMPAWKDLAAKYPFADSTNDATFADIQRFLRPDGPLADFMDKDLAGMVESRTAAMRPSRARRTCTSAAVSFPASTSWWWPPRRPCAAARGSIFELRPEPDPRGLGNGLHPGWQRLVYRNQQEEWKQFTWPGTASPEATVQVVSNGGVAPQILKFPGRMGLLGCWRSARERRRPSAPNSTGSSPCQELQRSPAEGGRRPHGISLSFPPQLPSVSGSDPRLLLKLRRLQLPDRITQ